MIVSLTYVDGNGIRVMADNLGYARHVFCSSENKELSELCMQELARLTLMSFGVGARRCKGLRARQGRQTGKTGAGNCWLEVFFEFPLAFFPTRWAVTLKKVLLDREGLKNITD